MGARVYVERVLVPAAVAQSPYWPWPAVPPIPKQGVRRGESQKTGRSELYRVL